MKSILGIIAVGILSLGLGAFLPWWSIALAGLIGGWIFGKKATQAFVICILGTGLAWFLLGFWIDQGNASLLSSKVGELLGGLSPMLLILISALIGALVSGLAGLSGYFLKQTLSPATV